MQVVSRAEQALSAPRRLVRDVPRGWPTAVAVLAITVSGCGDRLASLTGAVTIDGQPAPKGLSLEFTPVGEGSASYATTDAAGRFEAAFTFRKMGIEPGEHLVRLLPSQIEAPLPEIGADGRPVATGQQAAGPPRLPQRYFQEIERITVVPGRNEHDFALSSEQE